jgi:hypothetical protein
MILQATCASSALVARAALTSCTCSIAAGSAMFWLPLGKAHFLHLVDFAASHEQMHSSFLGFHCLLNAE